MGAYFATGKSKLAKKEPKRIKLTCEDRETSNKRGCTEQKSL